MRIILALLIIATAGSSAFRFLTEAEIQGLERKRSLLIAKEEALVSDVQQLELSVEVLESARRLSELNASHLTLGTVKSGQLLDDRAFADVIGMDESPIPNDLGPESDVIGNMIGMVDPNLGEKELVHE